LRDTASTHDRETIGHRERLLLIMGDIEHRHAEIALDAFDLALQLLTQLAVEGAERLVHQQNRRREHDGAREGHALLLPA
jgi:hypothetical protein